MAPRFATFLYHEVTDDPRASGFQRSSAAAYKHPLREFRANLDLMGAARLPFVAIHDLERRSDDALLMTLDDGGKSNLHAADELERRGIVGHFFIATQMIGDSYFVSRADVAELRARGHIVGSHSHSHPNVFNSQTAAQMTEEWRTSRRILEDITGAPVLSCSVPGGDVNRDTYETAARCGYRFVFDSEPRYRLRRRAGLVVIGRVCPKAGTPPEVIERYTRFRGFRRAQLTRLTKRVVKRAVYPIYAAVHNAQRHAPP